MAAAPTFRRGDVIARRYQVVTKSGETSLWIGYHGFDKNNQTSTEQKGIPEPDVIIKVVRPELLIESAARSHLSRELQRVKGLQHPGMPRLIDVQPLDEMNTVALIEPIQSGLSQGVLLRRMVTFRKNEGFPLAEVRQISAQLASALSYVHGQMMCHGDLRLESVILRPDGAKLCDIGLGAALPRGPYLDAVKKAGEAELLAPEVRAGKQPDPRSDVFGLASLYRHLISLGQPAAWDAFLAEKPAMGTVLVRGMADEPGQRYSSIEALIADVEAVALTGAPIRKRLAQTPLAMAVAAGRLPAEELSRPVEEILPESGRSRRNSGSYDSVLAPLASGASTKSGLSSSQSSTRSARATANGDSASSKSKSDTATTSSPRNEPIPPSAISKSNRITLPGRSKLVTADSIESLMPMGRSPTTAKDATSDAAASGDGHVRAVAASQADATVPIRSRRSDSALATTMRGSAMTKAAARDGSAEPVRASSTATRREPSSADALSTDPNASGELSGLRSRPPSSDSERISENASRIALSSKHSPGSRTSPMPSGSSPRSERSLSQPIVPPHMVMASRFALLGALILAALVGALIAVVVILMLRPASAPAPAPSVLPGAVSSSGR